MGRYSLSTNMGLRQPVEREKVWFNDWVQNFYILDTHDHASGKGKQISASGIANGAVTDDKVSASANITTSKINPDWLSANIITRGSFRVSDVSGNYAGIKAPTSVTSYEITLPSVAPTLNQILISDGSNGLQWVNAPTLLGANVTLDNLGATAINTSLISDANNTDDLGTDSNEWKDVWTHNIKHNDASNPNLNITTEGNDGDINLTPNGSGTVNIPEGDLLIGTLEPVRKQLIQDYTVVGNVGDASQFMAGYTGWTIAELEHFFGAGKIYSYNKFATGALGTDTNGAYDYTMGAAAKSPSDGTGIMNVAGTAISFDGGDYATNATKLDNMTTVFSGAGKGFVHSFWVIAPTDGQPAGSSNLFTKTNSANDRYYFILSTSGIFTIETRGNSGTSKTIVSTTVLPNGANTIWTHVVSCWDTTYGLRLFINGVNEATDSTATTLMVDGTTTDFFIGGFDATPSNPFTGRIAQEIIINKVAEQRDIDILFATTRPEPAVLTGKTYTVTDFVRPEADTNYEIQGEAQILAKYGSKVWLQGRQYGETDTVKMTGMVM